MVRPTRKAFLLGLTAAQRLVELILSRRNARRLRARGGVESGQRQFRALFALHLAFLVSCALEPGRRRPRLQGTALAVLLAAQGLRYWAIASLGERWNVRVITLPGAPPIVRGPYRYIRHPNYVAVALECLALPLGMGAHRTAMFFVPLHIAMLASRIALEERALGARYAERLGQTPRFIPVRQPGQERATP